MALYWWLRIDCPEHHPPPAPTLDPLSATPLPDGKNNRTEGLPLTDKFYGLLEVGADVGHVAVLHRDPLVVVVALGRLQVSARHIEQGRDVKVAEIVLSGGVVGTTEVEERQDLYRFTLKVR